MSDPGNFDPLFEACVSDSFSRIRESFLFSRVKRDSARVHADTPASEIRRFPPSGFDLRLDGSVAVSGRIPKVLASTAVAPESRLEFAANREEIRSKRVALLMFGRGLRPRSM